MNGQRFQIEYGPSALDDLAGLPARERAQILRKIERLQLGLHGNIKRLHEAEAMYRLRMGALSRLVRRGEECYRHPPDRKPRRRL